MYADARTIIGDWGPIEYCLNGANGFQLKVEDISSCGAGCDDTALNAIRLYCIGGSYITSTEGQWGQWQSVQYCPNGSRLKTFQLRTDTYNGKNLAVDDTAANDLKMKCDDGTALSNGGGGTRGTWGNEFACSQGYICSMKTNVQGYDPTVDNTALDSVMFQCCYP